MLADRDGGGGRGEKGDGGIMCDHLRQGLTGRFADGAAYASNYDVILLCQAVLGGRT